MKEERNILLNCAIMVIALGIAGVGWADPMGTAFTYQGRLYDANSPADGEYDMEFKLYLDYPTGQIQVGNTIHKEDLDVADGFFATELDFGEASYIFGGDKHLLEIRVRPGEYFWADPNGYSTLSPRQELTPAPYALHSKNADTLDWSDSSAFASSGHDHDGSEITSGQVDETYIDTDMATDTEVAAGLATKADVSHSHDGVYALVSHEHDGSYVNETGDSMSGSLTVTTAGDYSVKGESSLPISGKGVYGKATSTSGKGVYGKATAGWGFGVYGEATDLSNENFGVFGKSDSTSGKGVYGRATAASGTTYGVYGKSESTSGYGVYGEATADSGSAYGGYFKTDGTTGRGVYGEATNTTGYLIDFAYGGFFKAKGDYGRAVLGWASKTGATTNYGGKFIADGDSGYGVYGKASATTGTNYGGYFTSASADGFGVYGENTSTGSFGYLGGASHSVYGQAVSSGEGVTGMNTTNNTVGKLGTSSYGVYGIDQVSLNFGYVGGEDYGVYGEDFNSGNYGALGDPNAGVYGESTDGYAGYFEATGTNGTGIFATGGANGYAAEFDGDVIIHTGRVTTPVLEITGGSDLSERFEISGAGADVSPSRGMVVSIDPENPGGLVVSDRVYDRRVAGIISGAGGVKPGMLMGQKGTEADGEHPVALTGRVYCLADASTGSIEPGDLLTTSDTAGHAMKVTHYARAQGAILGKAMMPLAEGRGLVLVLVTLQ